VAQRSSRRRKGAKGKVIKSNRTDNESAKMATSKGVIQGYTGVAAVDARHQIIVEAQAHGTGSEQALLMPVVEAAAPLCTPRHPDHGGRRLPLRRQPQGAGRTRPAGTDRGQPDEEAR
jgi:hypothetical protein